MYDNTDNLITEDPAAWLQALMDHEPKHMGDTDTVTAHDHRTLDSILTCTESICASLLTPDATDVLHVGKHGVRYARGN